MFFCHHTHYLLKLDPLPLPHTRLLQPHLLLSSDHAHCPAPCDHTHSTQLTSLLVFMQNLEGVEGGGGA